MRRGQAPLTGRAAAVLIVLSAASGATAFSTPLPRATRGTGCPSPLIMSFSDFKVLFLHGKGENGETFQRRLAPLQAALKERIPTCQCEFTTVRLSEGHRRLVRAFQMLASTPLTKRHERIGPARTGARQVCLVEAPARRAVLHGPGIYRRR